jgi:hypothetical protein
MILYSYIELIDNLDYDDEMRLEHAVSGDNDDESLEVLRDDLSDRFLITSVIFILSNTYVINISLLLFFLRLLLVYSYLVNESDSNLAPRQGVLI